MCCIEQFIFNFSEINSAENFLMYLLQNCILNVQENILSLKKNKLASRDSDIKIEKKIFPSI